MTIHTTWANAMGPLACLVEQKAITIKFSRFRHVSTLSASWSFIQQSQQVSILPPGPCAGRVVLLVMRWTPDGAASTP